MSNAAEPPARRPRFPFVAAALCAACVGAAAWTWMRYSHCWDVAPEDFPQSLRVRWITKDHIQRLRNLGFAVPPNYGKSMIPGWDRSRARGNKYLRLDGKLQEQYGGGLLVTDGDGNMARVIVPQGQRLPNHPGDRIQLKGRARFDVWTDGTVTWVVIDTTASRFHGASIAGLVVGAMGVFVLTVALRQWLKERRAFSAPVGE